MMKKIIIAIDGYSSTGKSTLAKMLSKHFSYRHINTGAMYRAVTLFAIRNKWIDDTIGADSVDSLQIINSIEFLKFDFRLDNYNHYRLYLNNEDVEDLIKSPLVSKYVSLISTYSALRKKIISIQQNMGQSKAIVMEGRDIGSVVFPDADVKLFITASAEVRAQRRYQELLDLGVKVRYEDVLENLKMRDFSDTNRKNSPLIQVKDALLIDNTSLTVDQQFDIVVGIINDKLNLL